MFNVIPDHVAGKTRTCIKGLEALCNIPYTTATTIKDSLLLIKSLLNRNWRFLNDTNFNGKYSFPLIDRIGLEPINTFYERDL